MVKIGIVEDGIEDVIARYSQLNKGNSVHVRFDGRISNFALKSTLRRLTEAGFDVSKFYFKKPLEEHPELPDDLDIYFVDGLQGMCFGYVRKYGENRTHIVSNDPNILKGAREKGLSAVDADLSKDFIDEKIDLIWSF